RRRRDGPRGRGAARAAAGGTASGVAATPAAGVPCAARVQWGEGAGAGAGIVRVGRHRRAAATKPRGGAPGVMQRGASALLTPGRRPGVKTHPGETRDTERVAVHRASGLYAHVAR